MRRHSTLAAAASILASFWGVWPACGGDVWFVDQNAPGGQTGTSWNDAFHTLQDALADADTGDEIRVAQGTYYPGEQACSRTATFQLVSGVQLWGSYAGSGSADPDERDPALYPTILSGDVGAGGQCADNVYHVVTGTGTDASALLDGFVIEGGQADAGFPDDRGGGLVNDPGGPTVRNCVFRYHFAQSGGAIYTGYGPVPLLENCVFLENTASSNGGALLNLGSGVDVRGCQFIGNVSDLSGGAISDLYGPSSYENCLFWDNLAVYKGGAVYNLYGAPTYTGCEFRHNHLVGTGSSVRGGGGMYNESGAPTLIGCSFIDNLSTRQGGGIANRKGDLTLLNCGFFDNLATSDGGAVYSLEGDSELTNCALVGNMTLGRGGGLLSDVGDVVLTNCSITSNRCFAGGGGGVYIMEGAALLASNILWDNRDINGQGEDGQVYTLYGSFAVDYCCVQGWSGTLGGVGNVGAEPLFVDLPGPDGVAGTEDDNLALAPVSPCADTGDPEYDPGVGETDLLGHLRVVCDRVDMGALEFGRVPGDLTCDRFVMLADFAQWAECAAGPGAGLPDEDCAIYDFNGSESIDLADYAGFQRALTFIEP